MNLQIWSLRTKEKRLSRCRLSLIRDVASSFTNQLPVPGPFGKSGKIALEGSHLLSEGDKFNTIGTNDLVYRQIICLIIAVYSK